MDEIGDVVEVDAETFEPVPDNVDPAARDLLQGVYKLKDRLLLVLDTEKTIDIRGGQRRRRRKRSCGHWQANIASGRWRGSEAWPSLSSFATNKCWSGWWITSSPSWRAAAIPASGTPARPWGKSLTRLAMILAERMGHFAFNNLRIDATDVESTGQFAGMIEAAVYPREELSRLPDGILEKYFEPNGKPGLLSRDRQHPAAGRVPAARSFVVPGNRPGIFAGLVQECAAPLPAAGEDRGAQNVSPRPGARRLVRQRADAGDAAGARAAVRAGDSRRASCSAKWRAPDADRDFGK